MSTGRCHQSGAGGGCHTLRSARLSREQPFVADGHNLGCRVSPCLLLAAVVSATTAVDHHFGLSKGPRSGRHRRSPGSVSVDDARALQLRPGFDRRVPTYSERCGALAAECVWFRFSGGGADDRRGLSWWPRAAVAPSPLRMVELCLCTSIHSEIDLRKATRFFV